MCDVSVVLRRRYKDDIPEIAIHRRYRMGVGRTLRHVQGASIKRFTCSDGLVCTCSLHIHTGIWGKITIMNVSSVAGRRVATLC